MREISTGPRVRCLAWFLAITLLTLAWTTLSTAQSTETTNRHTASQAADTAAQTNWPQVFFDNARTGLNPSEKILSRSTVHRLKQEWAFNVGGYVSGPAVAQGIAYTGSGDGHVYAIDVSTGKLLWRVLLDKSFGASWPTVVDGKVYVGTGVIYGFPTSGLLAALDARNGKLLKTVSTLENITGIAVVDVNVYSAGYITTKLLIKYGLGK
jgi:outer membrane protein assembly factor BamB